MIPSHTGRAAHTAYHSFCSDGALITAWHCINACPVTPHIAALFWAPQIRQQTEPIIDLSLLGAKLQTTKWGRKKNSSKNIYIFGNYFTYFKRVLFSFVKILKFHQKNLICSLTVHRKSSHCKYRLLWACLHVLVPSDIHSSPLTNLSVLHDLSRIYYLLINTYVLLFTWITKWFSLIFVRIISKVKFY